MNGDLPDVNAWIAMSVDRHDHHKTAMEYWDQESVEPIVFCRTTTLGLVRVLSGRHAAGGDPLTLTEAWQTYLAWRADEDVDLWSEPGDVDRILGAFIEEGLVTSKNSTDAYLAAFAITGGLRLVTFDRDFERFPGLDLLRL